MNSSNIDYDSVAELYDLYVTATYDFEFFLAEAAKAEGPVLELTAGTGHGALRRLRPIAVRPGLEPGDDLGAREGSGLEVFSQGEGAEDSGAVAQRRGLQVGLEVIEGGRFEVAAEQRGQPPADTRE
jgi:hypothetical protein